jgi:hypothetical protein
VFRLKAPYQKLLGCITSLRMRHCIKPWFLTIVLRVARLQDSETRVFQPYYFATSEQIVELLRAIPGQHLVLVLKREGVAGPAAVPGYVQPSWLRDATPRIVDGLAVATLLLACSLASLLDWLRCPSLGSFPSRSLASSV